MRRLLQIVSAALAITLGCAGAASADSYTDSIHTFKDAGKSGSYFAKSYGYAVFPTVGGAGFIVGAAEGSEAVAFFRPREAAIGGLRAVERLGSAGGHVAKLDAVAGLIGGVYKVGKPRAALVESEI